MSIKEKKAHGPGGISSRSVSVASSTIPIDDLY